MASRFILPYADVGSGILPSSGAKLFFYETGTSTPKDTYTDSAATIPNANPVIADSTGLFGDIWISGTYKVVLKDKNDVQIWEADPIVDTVTSSVIIAPISFDPKDYGATAGVDSNTEIQDCYDAANAAGGTVYLSGTYRSDDSINVYSLKTTGPGTLDFSNATTLSLDNACLWSEGTLTDLGQPSANIVKGNASITMASAPSLNQADVIFIASTEQFTNARAAYTRGEAPIVQSVSGNDIDVYGNHFDDYTFGDTTVFKLNPVSPKFEDITVIAPDFRFAIGIHVKNGKNVTVGNVTCYGAGTKSIQFQQCVDSTIDNTYSIEDRENVDTTTGTEYGLVIANCQRVSVSGSTMVGERHGITTGGFANDYPNEVVAIVVRECTFDGNFISNDLLLSTHLTGGAAVQSFDLHGNSEFVTATGNTILNGVIWAGNNNTLTGNAVSGSNDNSSALLRCTEMVGLDHVISGNIFTATVGLGIPTVPIHFLNLPITHSNVVGVDNKNALRFGGTFLCTGNTFVSRDQNIAANTKPHEITYRVDSSFTGEDINIVFENNTTEFPDNGNLFSTGLRLLTLSNGTTTPTPCKLMQGRGNRWINCGGIHVTAETLATQYSANEVIIENEYCRANEQAERYNTLVNVQDYISFSNNRIEGVTKFGFSFTCASLTTKDATTLTKNVVVRDNEFRGSITAATSSTEKNMGQLIGFNEAIVENNKNFTAAGTNIVDLFYFQTFDTSDVWRSNNIDTSGIESYNLAYVSTTDHFNQTYKHWEAAETGAFLLKIDDKVRIDSSGGIFSVTMPVSPPDNAEFNLLDVGSSLSTNNVTLTYNGSETIMGSAADYILDVNNVNYGFTLLGTDWRINNG